MGLSHPVPLGKVRVNVLPPLDSGYSQSSRIQTPQRSRLGMIQTGVGLKFIFAVFTQKDLQKLGDGVNEENYNISGEKV